MVRCYGFPQQLTLSYGLQVKFGLATHYQGELMGWIYKLSPTTQEGNFNHLQRSSTNTGRRQIIPLVRLPVPAHAREWGANDVPSPGNDLIGTPIKPIGPN